MAVFNMFLTFFGAVFFVMTHIYGQTKYILQKNCPHISFPCCREAPNILHPLLKRPHRLLNWQIQVTRVSWVGQSTSDADNSHLKCIYDCYAWLFWTSRPTKGLSLSIYIRIVVLITKTPWSSNIMLLKQTMRHFSGHPWFVRVAPPTCIEWYF